MSWRIHKQIGFGLKDVKTDRQGEIDDPRFNPKGFLGSDRPRRNEKWTVAGYAVWLDNRHKTLGGKELSDYHFESAYLKNRPIKEKSDFRDFITHGNKEGGLSKVVCVIPTMMYKEWHRWDDAIDYAESRSMRSYVKLFDSNFYPWNVGFWDTRTGESVEDAIHYIRSKKSKFVEEKLAMANFVGFDTCQEADLYLKPRVPSCVQMTCEYCELFSDPKVVRQLQPMMYVYWA